MGASWAGKLFFPYAHAILKIFPAFKDVTASGAGVVGLEEGKGVGHLLAAFCQQGAEKSLLFFLYGHMITLSPAKVFVHLAANDPFSGLHRFLFKPGIGWIVAVFSCPHRKIVIKYELIKFEVHLWHKSALTR